MSTSNDALSMRRLPWYSAAAVVFFAFGFGSGYGFRETYLSDRMPEHIDDGARRQFTALTGTRKLFAAGHGPQSEGILNHLAESGWVRPQALFFLGKLALLRLDVDGACRYWQKLHADFPDTKSARAVVGPLAALHIGRGRPVSKDLKFAAATYLSEIEEYSKALALLDPQDETHAYYRLRILNRARRYDEAISCARDFRHDYPDSPRLESVLVGLAYNLGTRKREFEEALACYDYLLERFPASAQRAATMLAMGDCLVGLGQLERARGHYLGAAQIAGQERIAQIACYSTARTYFREGDREQGRAWLEKASRCEGELAEKIWRELGNLYLESGEPEKARAAFAMPPK